MAVEDGIRTIVNYVIQNWIIAVLLILSILAACGKKEKNQKEKVFDLEKLWTEEGIYQYKDIPFGSSYGEVVKKLTVEFQEPSADGALLS